MWLKLFAGEMPWSRELAGFVSNYRPYGVSIEMAGLGGR